MSAIGDQSFLRQMPLPPLPAPSARAGAFGWMRIHLFSSPGNIALTILCVALIVWLVPPLVGFFLIDA
ncbi:MAG: amino acid ABC transporter permease, partial [Xanthobacteraceae bacterium]